MWVCEPFVEVDRRLMVYFFLLLFFSLKEWGKGVIRLGRENEAAGDDEKKVVREEMLL